MGCVTLIATGGTIASTRGAGSNRVTANVSGQDLKSRLHDPLEGISLAVEDFATVGSFAMDLPMAFKLATRINAELARDDCDGVVVTHGTDTMEESCYLADLLLQSDKPVVFTGAQRHAGDPDTDGPRNIADAVRVAASAKSRGLGALIVFEQEIHAARYVTKVHTSRVDTFRSPGFGKIGEVDGGSVFVSAKPVAGDRYTVERIVDAVELFKLSMGCSPWFVDAAVERGALGIVLEAFGRGNAPPTFVDCVSRLTDRKVPVLISSRCAEGRTKAVYGGGGGIDLVEAGAILTGSLSGVKARILLGILLALGQDRTEIAENAAFSQ